MHGRPAAEIREVTRRVPYFHDGGGARELFATHPNFRGLKLPAVWQEFAAQAEALVGTPRHLSLHPGGVVIVPTALTDVVPIEPAAKRLDGAPDLTVPVIQFEKDGAEDAGLVKIDLLGNRSLAVIRDAIAPLGGHATLVRAPDDVRLAVAVFQPLAPPLMELSRKLKAQFDPAGILNPGRMYAGV